MSNDDTGDGETDDGAPPESAGDDDGDGSAGEADVEALTEAESLEERARRLDQRERGIESWADDLDDRETELSERETELSEREAELVRKREQLEEKQASLSEREQELDDREEAIQNRETELSEREAELDRHEQTLETYVRNEVEDLEGVIEENVWSALDAYEDSRDDEGRFGTAGNVLVGLVGLVLVVAGVGYVVGAAYGGFPSLFGSSTADLAVTAILAVVGLAANLVAVADRL
jgi:ribonuclease Y